MNFTSGVNFVTYWSFLDLANFGALNCLGSYLSHLDFNFLEFDHYHLKPLFLVCTQYVVILSRIDSSFKLGLPRHWKIRLSLT